MAVEEAEIRFNEWQEEEITVPSLEMEAEVDEAGQLRNVKPQMVEKKVKQRYTYTKLLPHRICEPGQHYFEIQNGGRRVAGRVEVRCRHCPTGAPFVPGVHSLVDGQIVQLQK